MSNRIAWLVNRAVSDLMTYGRLIMNAVYGGMNLRSAKTAISFGDGHSSASALTQHTVKLPENVGWSTESSSR